MITNAAGDRVVLYPYPYDGARGAVADVHICDVFNGRDNDLDVYVVHGESIVAIPLYTVCLRFEDRWIALSTQTRNIAEARSCAETIRNAVGNLGLRASGGGEQ